MIKTLRLKYYLRFSMRTISNIKNSENGIQEKKEKNSCEKVMVENDRLCLNQEQIQPSRQWEPVS